MNIKIIIIPILLLISCGSDEKPTKKLENPPEKKQEQDIYVNVKTFGALGDGKTDDSNAIQSAIDSLTSGGSVLFPNGSYRINKTLHLNWGIHLVGSSMQSSIILVNPDIDGITGQPFPCPESSNLSQCENKGYPKRIAFVGIENLAIYRPDKGAANKVLVDFNNIDDSYISNTRLIDATDSSGTCLRVRTEDSQGTFDTSSNVNLGATRNLFSNVIMGPCLIGYQLSGMSNSAVIRDGRINETVIGVNISGDISSNNVTVDGVAIESTKNCAIGVYTNSANTNIINNRFELGIPDPGNRVIITAAIWLDGRGASPASHASIGGNYYSMHSEEVSYLETGNSTDSYIYDADYLASGSPVLSSTFRAGCSKTLKPLNN